VSISLVCAKSLPHNGLRTEQSPPGCTAASQLGCRPAPAAIRYRKSNRRLWLRVLATSRGQLSYSDRHPRPRPLAVVGAVQDPTSTSLSVRNLWAPPSPWQPWSWAWKHRRPGDRITPIAEVDGLPGPEDTLGHARRAGSACLPGGLVIRSGGVADPCFVREPGWGERGEYARYPSRHVSAVHGNRPRPGLCDPVENATRTAYTKGDPASTAIRFGTLRRVPVFRPQHHTSRGWPQAGQACRP
jgi:hypothetical protein